MVGLNIDQPSDVIREGPVGPRRPGIVGVLRRQGVLGFLVSVYLALLPFQIPINADMNFALADPILLLTLLLAAGKIKYHKPAWSVWHSALMFVFVVGTFVAASSAGYLESYVWLNKDVGLFALFLSYAAITSVATDWGQTRFLLRVFTLSVVIQNQVAILSFIVAYTRGVNTVFTMYGGQRLSGMLLDPNAYGGLLALTFILCEGASWGPEPLFKGALLMYCRLTLGLGILFTFSRSAWISLILPLLVLCVRQRRKAIQLAMGGMMAALCSLVFMGPHFSMFFENMAGRPERGITRFDLIRDAWGHFAQHPVLGGGLGSFALKEGTVVHNTSMWFLADFGILGFGVFIGFLAWFFWAGWSAYCRAPLHQKPVPLALLLGNMVMLGLSMGIEAFYQRHWWMVFALIASTSTIVGRKPQRRHVVLDGAVRPPN